MILVHLVDVVALLDGEGVGIVNFGVLLLLPGAEYLVLYPRLQLHPLTNDVASETVVLTSLSRLFQGVITADFDHIVLDRVLILLLVILFVVRFRMLLLLFLILLQLVIVFVNHVIRRHPILVIYYRLG